MSLNVIIIGKERKSCRKLKRFLEKKGAEAHYFLKAMEATIYMKLRGPADILVSEFEMPQFSGLLILRTVSRRYPKMVTICLSEDQSHEGAAIQGKEDESILQDDEVEGFDLFFLTPVDKELLWEEALKMYKWKKDAVLE